MIVVNGIFHGMVLQVSAGGDLSPRGHDGCFRTACYLDDGSRAASLAGDISRRRGSRG